MKVDLFCDFDIIDDDKEVLKKLFNIEEVKETGEYKRLEISCDGNLCRCETCSKEYEAEGDIDETHDSYLTQDYYHYYSLESKEEMDLNSTLSFLSSYQSYLSKSNFDNYHVGKVEILDNHINYYMYQK